MLLKAVSAWLISDMQLLANVSVAFQTLFINKSSPEFVKNVRLSFGLVARAAGGSTLLLRPHTISPRTRFMTGFPGGNSPHHDVTLCLL